MYNVYINVLTSIMHRNNIKSIIFAGHSSLEIEFRSPDHRVVTYPLCG